MNARRAAPLLALAVLAVPAAPAAAAPAAPWKLEVDWLEAAANRDTKRCAKPGQMYLEVFYAVSLNASKAKVEARVAGTRVLAFTRDARTMDRGWMAGDQADESRSATYGGCIPASRRGDVRVTLTALGSSPPAERTTRAADRIWGC